MIHRILALLAASLMLSGTGSAAESQPRKQNAAAQKAGDDLRPKSNGGVISITYPVSSTGTTGRIRVVMNQAGHPTTWQFRLLKSPPSGTWLPNAPMNVNTTTNLLTATDWEVKIIPTPPDTFTTSPLLIRVYAGKTSTITIAYP